MELWQGVSLSLSLLYTQFNKHFFVLTDNSSFSFLFQHRLKRRFLRYERALIHSDQQKFHHYHYNAKKKRILFFRRGSSQVARETQNDENDDEKRDLEKK
jgi:thermostable 8-oxoguanine DNA glycosylase